jgi:hypothetical protein
MKINVKIKNHDKSVEKHKMNVDIEVKNVTEFLEQYAGNIIYIYLNPLDINADPKIKIEHRAISDVEVKLSFDINDLNKILQSFQERTNAVQVQKLIQEASISLVEFSKSLNFSLTIPNNKEFLEKHIGKKTHIDINPYDSTSMPKIKIESDMKFEIEDTSEQNIELDIQSESKEPELNIELRIDNELANALDGLRDMVNSLEELFNTSNPFDVKLDFGSSYKYETKLNVQQSEQITDNKSLNQIEQIRKRMLESINDILKWTMQLVSLHVPEGNDHIEEMLLQLENYRLHSKPEKNEELEKTRLKRLDVINDNLKTVNDIIKSATEQISRIQEWKQNLKGIGVN